MKIQNAIVIIIIVAGSVTVMAAGEAQPKPATQGTNEACTFLTKEDAAAALGEAATGPKGSAGRSSASPGTTASACEYSGSGIHRINLNVMHFAPDMAAMYRAMCAQKGKEGLSGLGDTACWYNDKHEELQVLKGTTFFSIELRRSGNPTEPIKDVARKVFDRIK